MIFSHKFKNIDNVISKLILIFIFTRPNVLHIWMIKGYSNTKDKYNPGMAVQKRYTMTYSEVFHKYSSDLIDTEPQHFSIFIAVQSTNKQK